MSNYVFPHAAEKAAPDALEKLANYAGKQTSQFARPWNTTGRSWIEARVPGPWAVDNTPDGSAMWGVVNTNTGRYRKVGPVYQPRSKQRINYFDRAMDLADSLNAAIAKFKEQARANELRKENGPHPVPAAGDREPPAPVEGCPG